MDSLELLAKNSERLIKEFNWSKKQYDELVGTVNAAVNRALSTGKDNDETDNSLVVHEADYSGAFILFGGWTEIYDHAIPSGTRGHELYLAFGGVGVGGWSGACDIELMTEGTFTYDSKTYNKPINYYSDASKSEWEQYNTAFAWFHDHVKSFAFMYLPLFAQPIPVFVYFDSDSNQIGLSIPDYSLSIGVGGGTVSVKA